MRTEGPAHKVGIGTELRAPEAFAHNRRDRRAGLIIGVGQGTTEDRARTDHALHTRRGQHDAEAQLGTTDRDVDRNGPPHHADLLEQPGVVPEMEVLGRRGTPHVVRSGTGHFAQQHHQAIGAWKRQRFDHDVFECRVDRHRHTKARAEREHGHGRESRCARQAPGRLAEVDEREPRH